MYTSNEIVGSENRMRTENIKIKFEIPLKVDRPDLNGTIYTREAIKNAFKNVKDVPIGIYNDEGCFIPIGVSQEVELIENENNFFVKGIGLVFYGGTGESVDIEDGKVTQMNITAIGFDRESENNSV